MSQLINNLKRIDAKATIDIITKRMKTLYEELKAAGIILEVKNTVNSLINVLISIRSVGKANCYGIFFEGTEGGSKNIDRLYRMTRFNLLRIDIRHIYRYVKKNIPEITVIPKKVAEYRNLENDLKILFLREYARENNLIFSGDICKSEWLVGAFDKYYISNVDVLPLTGLYKTQLKVIARTFRIAHLVKHANENKYWIEIKRELGIEGIPDEKLDGILSGIVDYRWEIKKMVSDLKVKEDLIERIRLAVESTELIRHTPIIF